MRNIILAVVAVAVLSGCAYSRMPELSKYQAEYVSDYSAELVSAVVFKRPGSSGDLVQCIAETVSNQGVTLRDSAGSFVGAATGRYYSASNSAHVGGGDVLQYVSADGKSVVANGSTQYSSGFVSRSVRYKLSAQQKADERVYRFADLSQAQLNTGSAANYGYGGVGAWSGANPDLALASLEQVSAKIEACLAR